MFASRLPALGTLSLDPGFKHVSAITDNIFARFALPLSATPIDVVKE